MKNTLVALCLLFLISHRLSSQVFVIDDSFKKKILLNESSFLFKENGKKLGINEILAPSNQVLFKETNGKMHFRFSKDALWFKFSLQNQSFKNSNYFIEIGNPTLDEISLFETQENHIISEQKLGDKLPFSSRLIPVRNHVANLQLNDTLIHHYYIRVFSLGNLAIPISISRLNDYISKDNVSTLELGAGIGLLFLTAFYTLILCIFTKETKYLFYSLFILCSAGFLILRNGIGIMYLWPNAIEWNNQAVLPFLFGTFLFSTLFSYSFLAITDYAPRWSKVLKAEIVIYTLLTCWVSFNPNIHLNSIAGILALTHNVIMIATGVIAWQKGHRSARLYTTGMIVFATVVVFHTLGMFSIMPPFFATLGFMRFGLYLEMLFLTVAITKNYRGVIKDLASAKTKEVIQKKENKILEDTITQKQKELATLSMQIQNKNNTLAGLKTAFDKKENNHNDREVNKLKAMINDNLNLDEEWGTFKIHFEDVHDSFFQNLQSVANLSVNELKLCAYIKVNLSTKEISRILRVKPTSVQVARHRLKKKLSLKESEDLISFIKDI